MAYGDSKATSYTPNLLASLNAIPVSATVSAESDNLSIPGITLSGMMARYTSDLAARGSQDGMNYRFVLLTVGVNDVVAGLPPEATWRANFATLIDAIHAKFPAAKVGIARPWERGAALQAGMNSLATWIAAEVTPRAAWAFLGPDERVYLENGDNGTTYTDDGIHPNAAGQAVAASLWKTAMGY
jgi:lysophospholipase L1-like esterase